MCHQQNENKATQQREREAVTASGVISAHKHIHPAPLPSFKRHVVTVLFGSESVRKNAEDGDL